MLVLHKCTRSGLLEDVHNLARSPVLQISAAEIRKLV